MLRRWGTLVLFALAAPALALAQNTGKLSGQVLDASTGEPLPGAAVIIEGTQLGAATDVEGNYFIIGVPVGTYDVRSTFVGFSPQTVAGVEINAGYTRQIDFELSPGVELEGVVVEYERPLIQNDAIGVPNVTTAEDIANLPVRGVANVAALQGGVVKEEGSDNLYIRGGREQGVSYYVDGVKVLGDNVSVTALAVQEQEMLIGSIPARYGDATSGVISITTKTGSPNFFGTIEGISSEVLDPYGYNQLSATLGGPLFSESVSFFLAGDYSNLADSNPRAIGFPQLSESDLAFVQNRPQVVGIINDETEEVSYIPFPGDLGNTALGDTTFPAEVLEMLEGDLPEGFSFLDPSHPEPVEAPTTYLEERFTREDAKPNDPSRSLTLNGNIQVSPLQSIRLRVGGSYETSSGREFSYLRSLYAPNRFRRQDRDTWRGFLSFTQYLSNSTFYQIQADYSDYRGFNYHPDFSNNVEDVLQYGDISHPANAVARRYKRYEDEVGAYVNFFEDGSLPTVRQIQSNFTAPGGETFGGYTKWHYNRFGLRASAQTQLGVHQLEFGGEFEQQTRRYFNISDPYGLARFERDGNVEGDASFAVDEYEELAFNVMDDEVFYYGYNYLGTDEVDDQDLDAFTGKENFNVAPYQPIYYAGYVSDKIEYRDLVLQVGVRLDVFDNNALVLRDPYALFPLVRAGEVGNLPAGIGADFAPYFDNAGEVVGYRDLEGNFYDPSGLDVTADVIRGAGEPRIRTDESGEELRRLTPEVFEDYTPEVTFQPRIGVSFPVTDQALFFASYDVVSQRPTENRFDTIQQYAEAIEGSKLLDNPNLKPEKRTNYELGFRQRLGARAALQISGFFSQLENQISRRVVPNVFPNNYQTYENVDFGTVKGVELEFDLRRTRNLAINANYTLSYAQGTGSDPSTTNQIVWRQEQNPFYPRFISPLSFDQRHKFNLTLDYRLGEEEGPQVAGIYPLANFGVNAIGNFGSGFPYTAQLGPHPIWDSFIQGPEGEINGQQMPASALINLRIDRRFSLGGGADLVAFLWVQNLLNTDNAVDVYEATGLPGNDGYLSSDLGESQIQGRALSQGLIQGASFVDHYNFRQLDPFNFGIPRQTRLGLRVSF